MRSIERAKHIVSVVTDRILGIPATQHEVHIANADREVWGALNAFSRSPITPDMTNRLTLATDQYFAVRRERVRPQ